LTRREVGIIGDGELRRELRRGELRRGELRRGGLRAQFNRRLAYDGRVGNLLSMIFDI
jgi:hypothetical protein